MDHHIRSPEQKSNDNRDVRYNVYNFRLREEKYSLFDSSDENK